MVMRSRIRVQKAYAYWTRVSHIFRHLAMSENQHQLRSEMLLYSLTGTNGFTRHGHDTVNTVTSQMYELDLFLKSPAVQKPFREYCDSYLRFNPQTRNPKWNKIQPVLADTNLRNTVLRTYGFFLPDSESIDKTIVRIPTLIRVARFSVLSFQMIHVLAFRGYLSFLRK